MPTRERKMLELAELMSNQADAHMGSPVGSWETQVTNQGVSNFSNGSGHEPVFNEQTQAKFMELIQNNYQFLSRGSMINRWMDPRRDYNKEAGYPETHELTSEKWQDYYDRHSIAGRVIELMPHECWQVTPELEETEDPEDLTPFEQAFENLSSDLRGEDSRFRPNEKQAHPIWEVCRRADILSGIGQFGIILLGFDDGLSLNQPVEGWQEPQSGQITWNEEGVEWLQEHVINHSESDLLTHDSVGDFVHLDENGKLVWNIKAVKKEEEEEDEEGNVVKKKRTGYIPGIDPTVRSEKYDAGTSMPSSQAFGNTGDQQSPYRNPMDIHGQDDPKPMDDQQPKPGNLVTRDQRFTGDNGGANEAPEGEPGIEQPQGPTRKLLYVRVFPESLVQIMQYEQNMASPRFGQPVLYRVTLNDPTQQQTGVGLPLSTVEVHYSRIIHIADIGANAVSSEIFAAPRCRPVLNHLIDLQKMYSSAGEGYWKNAFATLAAETHPQLGGDVTLNTTELSGQMKKWRDSLDRILATTGITWKTLAPALADPNSYVNVELQAICIKLGCPLRVFMGSEQGVLAASEDARAWSYRVRERRKNYITPRIIVPLIDRLIKTGVLPTPESYGVSWDEDQKLSPQEQAQVASALTQSLAAYISGQVDQLIEPVTYLVEFFGWDKDKAAGAIQATLEHINKQQEAQAMQGSQMVDPMSGAPIEQDPETGEYIDPNTGEPMQTDEFGKPVMINPETGEPMPVQQQSAGEAQGPLGAEAAEQQMGQDPQAQESMNGPEGQPLPPDQIMQGQEEQPQGQGMDPAELEQRGLQQDPETGYIMDPDSGLLVDPNTLDVFTKGGEKVGNLNDLGGMGEEEGGEEQAEGGVPQVPSEEREDLNEDGQEDPEQDLQDQEQEITGAEPSAEESEEESSVEPEPEATDSEYPRDPETGRIVLSNGNSLDPETGDVYDAQGNLLGNVRRNGQV